MSSPKPANFLSAESGSFQYTEKSSPQSSNLDFLTYRTYRLNGAVRIGLVSHPAE